MALPTDKQARKDTPMARGLLDYFPDACAEVAHVSFVANEQHNPGEEMHWAKEKSTDHADCIVRHLVERGTLDSDGLRHSAKVAWRALALLQIELESVEDERREGQPVEFDWYVEQLTQKVPDHVLLQTPNATVMVDPRLVTTEVDFEESYCEHERCGEQTVTVRVPAPGKPSI